jgi:hypothetical protein
MSMELYLATTSALPSAGQIGARSTQEGIPLLVQTIDWSTQSGFLPMTINGRDAGVEVESMSPQDSEEVLAAFGVPATPSTRIVAFRWGGDLTECGCALAAAASIASLTHGDILDPEAGEKMSVAQAFADARQCLPGMS